MASNTNLERLKTAYKLWNETKGFGPRIWDDLLADNIHLESVDEQAPGLSFAKDRHSKDEVISYLSAILTDWQMVHYTPDTYVCEGDNIAMFGKCAYVNKKTGKMAECQMGALWRFKGDKAIAMIEVFDSAKAVAAATP